MIDIKQPLELHGETLALRMGALIDAVGGPTKAAALVNASRDTMNNWKTGKSRIPFDSAYKLTCTAGVSMGWLATGVHSQGGANPSSLFTFVRRFDVELSAGNGTITGDREMQALAFRTDWLASHIGTANENLSVVQARGDSMEPTIQDRALVLVDHSIRSIRNDGIYAFRMDDALFIKRVQTQMLGGLLLLSDNPAYPSQAIDDLEAVQFTILGQVRWVGNAL